MKSNKDIKYTKPLTIDQAANYLQEHKKDIETAIRKEASEQQISQLKTTDAAKYLAYCISFLDDIHPDIVRYFPLNAAGGGVNWGKSDILNLLKIILIARINGYTYDAIRFRLKLPPAFNIEGKMIDSVAYLEVLGKISVGLELEKKKLSGTPIVGGL